MESTDCYFCRLDVDKKTWAMLLGPELEGKRECLTICTNCFKDLCKKLKGEIHG